MAISIRQQLKNRLQSVLSGLTINNKNIKTFLCSPEVLERSDLPAITIQTATENVDYTTVGYARSQNRSLSIEITCLYQATLNLDSIIDEFSTLIESKLAESEQMVRLNSDIVFNNVLDSVEFRSFDEIAERTAGATLNYTISYSCEENDLYASI